MKLLLVMSLLLLGVAVPAQVARDRPEGGGEYPGVPSIPSVPGVPGVPGVPEGIPEFPGSNYFPEIPGTGSFPSIPEAPAPPGQPGQQYPRPPQLGGGYKEIFKICKEKGDYKKCRLFRLALCNTRGRAGCLSSESQAL